MGRRNHWLAKRITVGTAAALAAITAVYVWLGTACTWLRERITTNRITAFATAVMAAVTAVYACISLAQLSALQSGNKTARDQLINSQRAFVSLVGVDLRTYGTHDDKGNVRWLAAPLIQNTGHTPASIVCMDFAILMRQPGTPEPWFDQADFKEPCKKGFLGPGVQAYVPNILGTDSATLNSVLHGVGDDLFFIAYIDYKDIFGPRRRTEWCFRLIPPDIDFQQLKGPATVRAITILCQHHNCADDECRTEE